VGFVDVYMSDHPATNAEGRGSLSFTVERPEGRVSYDPAPFVPWRVDVTDVAAITIVADYRHGVTYTSPTGSVIDLSHTGRVSMTRDGNDPRHGEDVHHVSVSLVLARLAPTPVVVQANGTGISASGTVAAGGSEIAAVSGSFFGGSFGSLDFAWSDACKP
jgi:hypothetical protein